MGECLFLLSLSVINITAWNIGWSKCHKLFLRQLRGIYYYNIINTGDTSGSHNHQNILCLFYTLTLSDESRLEPGGAGEDGTF